MSGISMGSAIPIAKQFPWKKYKTFIDVGGAQGCVPVLKKAHDALPKGGALIVQEAIIDDGRSKNAFGLLMSLNMPD
jgi:hypothetical protein